MRKIILTASALLTISVGLAQMQSILPASVQLFLDEQSVRHSMLSKGKTMTVEADKPIYMPPYMLNGVEMVDAFIRFDDRGALSTARAMGVIINCEFSNFATAQIPLDILTEVSNIRGVTNVEISKVMELCTDSTLSVTHAGQVINGTEYGLPQAYDGTGVIIGMIDSGYDYKHTAFRKQDNLSETRIVRIYDPLNTTGHPVIIGNNTLSGSVFMNEQIDTMRFDTQGTHGTHTTCIAAGRHQYGYGGMAPNAEIVLCTVRDMDIYISESRVINSMRYIFSYADSVGKPCVINLSISSSGGPHDGSDLISQAIAESVGPGRVFVISAGNDGAKNSYSCGAATASKPFCFLIGKKPNLYLDYDIDDSYYYDNTINEIWVRAESIRPVVKLHVYDKKTQHIVWESNYISSYKVIDSSEFSDYFEPDSSIDNTGNITIVPSLTDSERYKVTCRLHNLKSKEISIGFADKHCGRYQIGVSVYPPSVLYPQQTGNLYLDMWIINGISVNPPSVVYRDETSESGDVITTAINNYYAIPNGKGSIGNYAIHDSIISAGAYIGRKSYYSLNQGFTETIDVQIGSHLSLSSYQAEGYGPTGKALPTVCAPGHVVVSAGSIYSYFNSNWSKDLVFRAPNGNCYGVMTGTSMAAPTVAGIIAQWLQINPNLSPGDIKEIIAATAIKDVFTSDPHFGPNGKIDAMAGARYILNKMNPMITGDVNGDSVVDVDDITALITYVLGDNDPGIDSLRADVNGDSVIDVDDITLVIQLVLGN